MLARLPESWIPPDHLLDLRARVRLRHTLCDQRGEWQQRIQAVLYHHGLAQRRDLLTRENRAWVERAALPETAREQVTVALGMIDALDVQIAPIGRELRAYARRQAGCRALMGHYGIGELTAVTILAELGDCRRFSSSRHAVRYPAWTLIFGDPTAGARLLACDLAAAVDIPLRLAVIGRGDDASEIVLRDMRTLIDADIADDFTDVLRGLAEATRERI